jgi:hypothetical protein
MDHGKRDGEDYYRHHELNLDIRAIANCGQFVSGYILDEQFHPFPEKWNAWVGV